MIRTEWKTGGPDLGAARLIRYEVFTKEQKVPQELEFDELDERAYHLIVYDGDLPVATGRAVLDGEQVVLGRIAVLKEHRGKGFGDFVVRMLIRRSFELGAWRQVLHSQIQAAAFYEKLGFSRTGAEYLEAGMLHVNMERSGDISGNCNDE